MQRTSIAGSVAAAALALLAAGCGGTSHGSSVASITNASPAGCRPHCLGPVTASQAVAAAKASRCMRSHGVLNFPDPILGGHFGFTVQSGVDPYTPQFKAAFAYCTTRYRIFRHVSTPAQRAQSNAQAVRFSACMRSHGASGFPDPDGQGAIQLPTTYYMQTPVAQRAEGACKSLQVGTSFVFVVPVPVR